MSKNRKKIKKIKKNLDKSGQNWSAVVNFDKKKVFWVIGGSCQPHDLAIFWAGGGAKTSKNEKSILTKVVGTGRKRSTFILKKVF